MMALFNKSDNSLTTLAVMRKEHNEIGLDNLRLGKELAQARADIEGLREDLTLFLKHMGLKIVFEKPIYGKYRIVPLSEGDEND